MVQATEPASTTDDPPAGEAGPALKRTPLYQTHVALGARMVPFGGWEMPVQYASGVLAAESTSQSYTACRCTRG